MFTESGRVTRQMFRAGSFLGILVQMLVNQLICDIELYKEILENLLFWVVSK